MWKLRFSVKLLNNSLDSDNSLEKGTEAVNLSKSSIRTINFTTLAQTIPAPTPICPPTYTPDFRPIRVPQNRGGDDKNQHTLIQKIWDINSLSINLPITVISTIKCQSMKPTCHTFPEPKTTSWLFYLTNSPKSKGISLISYMTNLSTKSSHLRSSNTYNETNNWSSKYFLNWLNAAALHHFSVRTVNIFW